MITLHSNNTEMLLKPVDFFLSKLMWWVSRRGRVAACSFLHVCFVDGKFRILSLEE
jgi:hypothetical protein